MEVPYGFCISKAGRYRNDSRSEPFPDRSSLKKRRFWKRLQEERDQFDAKLAEDTKQKLDQIKQESEKKMEQILKEEKERHHSVIDNLENDYNQNRKAYVKEILERIIEV